MIDFHSRAFIFDMDGTLVDNMHVHTEAWGKLLNENGIEMDTHKFLVATAGKTNKEIMPTVFGNVTDERINELILRKESLYREAYLPVRKPVAGLVDFLTEAKSLGIKMAVATASGIPSVEFILDGLDLRRFFDAVTTAFDVKNGKPDPEFFVVSAEKLGVEPSNCIVFEDALAGFEAAHRAKMISIGITTVNSKEDILNCKSVVEANGDFTDLDPKDLIDRYLP